MKRLRLILSLTFASTAIGQLTTGSLNRTKPAGPAPLSAPTTPVAPTKPTASGAGGLDLNPRWNAPSTLGTPATDERQRELKALLAGTAVASQDTSPHPEKHIYREVKYLMDYKETLALLSLTGVMKAGYTLPTGGFPSGVKCEAWSAQPGRSFEVRLVEDRKGQATMIEFVAPRPENLPPIPRPTPDRVLTGRCYDFLASGDSIRGGGYQQAMWDFGDYVLITTRGGPKATDLYIPKPMVSIVLFCLDLSKR